MVLVLADISKHQSLTDRVKQGALSFLEDVEADVGAGSTAVRLRGAFRQTPLQALEAALTAVTKRLQNEDLYLAIAWDEFPDAVVSVIDNEGEQAAAALVGTLRRFREEFPERLRWLLTGSVGLHHALRRLGTSGEKFVTDLQVVPLGPLDFEWARYLAGCLLLGAGRTFDDDTLTIMASETDGIPYLLHLLAIRARDYGPAVIGGADVPELFDRAISDLDGSQQSTHLLTRLGDYYAPDTRAAEALLDCVAADRSTREELLVATGLEETLTRRLLSLLTRDHYIDADDSGGYTWRYNALRRIWVQRRSL